MVTLFHRPHPICWIVSCVFIVISWQHLHPNYEYQSLYMWVILHIAPCLTSISSKYLYYQCLIPYLAISRNIDRDNGTNAPCTCSADFNFVSKLHGGTPSDTLYAKICALSSSVPVCSSFECMCRNTHSQASCMRGLETGCYRHAVWMIQCPLLGLKY